VRSRSLIVFTRTLSGLAPDQTNRSLAIINMKRLAVLVAAVALLAFVGKQQNGSTTAPTATTVQSAKTAEPSCETDWHLCSDNSDLINNYKGDDLRHAGYECMSEANKLAKYGDPKWSWNPYKFSVFYKGDDYVKTGILRIVDKEVQFQNGFGAWVHVRVECEYDMNNTKVLNISADQSR
jgi:hypothetical protein